MDNSLLMRGRVMPNEKDMTAITLLCVWRPFLIQSTITKSAEIIITLFYLITAVLQNEINERDDDFTENGYLAGCVDL